MNTYKIGVIRVLTTEDPELLNLHGRLLEQYYPMFQTVSRCIPDQWEGIHDDATMAAGVPKVVAMARQMYEEGFDAIIVSCAGDPGVAQARAEVPIPVIGGGESTATLARFYGGKVGTLGITADIPEAYPRILGDALIPEAGIGEGVRSTLDLLTPAGREATMAAARHQQELGAQVLALSCTGMATIGIAPFIRDELGIPVLDPVLCEGAVTLFELLRRAQQPAPAQN